MNNKFRKITEDMYVEDGIVYQIGHDVIYVTRGSTELYHDGDESPFKRLNNRTVEATLIDPHE